MATEIITLPGHLRVLFDKVYEGEPAAATGWVVWQRVLQARTPEPAFFRRLAAVQLACRTLRLEVDAIPVAATSITARTKTSWIQAIDQLASLTAANDFHLASAQWKEKARQSDITLLDTMHVYYNLHNMFVELDLDERKKLADRLGALSEALKTGGLDGRVHRYFLRAVEELRFSLANVETFGFDSAWLDGTNLLGCALRFRNELAANLELQQQVAATAWQALQFLAATGGAAGGAVSVTDAALAVLSAAPGA